MKRKTGLRGSRLQMMQNDNDWVNEFFRSRVRDWTQSSVRHVANLLYVPIVDDSEATRRCASVLSNIELQRADRFITEEKKAHFIQRRAFRRYCGTHLLGSSRPLSSIVFNETEKGRPYLTELPKFWFSFSSCRSGFLAAWSSLHSIGVDFEDRTRGLEASELARQYFSQAEAEAVESVSGQTRLRTFLQLWSLKEAALKSIGEGLPYGLDAFQFELCPNLRVVDAPYFHGGPDRFDVHMIEANDTCGALVICEENSERK